MYHSVVWMDVWMDYKRSSKMHFSMNQRVSRKSAFILRNYIFRSFFNDHRKISRFIGVTFIRRSFTYINVLQVSFVKLVFELNLFLQKVFKLLKCIWCFSQKGIRFSLFSNKMHDEKTRSKAIKLFLDSHHLVSSKLWICI